MTPAQRAELESYRVKVHQVQHIEHFIKWLGEQDLYLAEPSGPRSLAYSTVDPRRLAARYLGIAAADLDRMQRALVDYHRDASRDDS